jgi:ribosomal protein S18 acetylase RimI-like enzyme
MVTVRPAGLADAEDVVRINIATWQHAYKGIVPDDVLVALDDRIPDRVRRTRERWSAPGPRPFQTLLAVDATTIGFVTFGPYRVHQGATDEVDPAVGEVLAIYIDPAQQGRGAGRALMDAAITALREGGAGEIRLWVLEANAPARAFYERYGFVADGARHFFRVERSDGTPVDLPELRYALPRNRPAATDVK